MAHKAWSDFFDESSLWRLERLRLVAKSALSRAGAGSRRSRRMGDGLEFADHRAYAPGDDLRFLDWNYYARREQLLMRLFHEHSEADVAILLDCSASMAPGGRMEKFHAARRAAAALAYVAMSGGERVRLAPFAEDLGEPLRTGRDRSRFFRVLEWLAELRPGGRTRLRHCVDRFLHRCDPRGPVQAGSSGGGAVSTVLILSDLLDCRQELAESLARLRLAGAGVCVIHLHSPADADPAGAGPLLLEQAEKPPGKPARRLSLLVGPEVLESYRLRWREFCDSCRRACLAEGGLYVPTPSDVHAEELLLLALRRAGVVQG